MQMGLEPTFIEFLQRAANRSRFGAVHADSP